MRQTIQALSQAQGNHQASYHFLNVDTVSSGKFPVVFNICNHICANPLMCISPLNVKKCGNSSFCIIKVGLGSIRLMREVWEKIREELKSRIPESSFKVWIAPLTYGGVDGESLLVECPNQFVANWIQEHYLPLVQHVLADYDNLKIRLVPAEKVSHAARNQLHLPQFAPNQLPRPNFCSRFTFQEFIVGEGNRYAYSTCRSTAESPADGCRVVYLQADSGLGKSHLSQAVGQAIMEAKPDTRLCYLSANEFTNQVVKAIRNGSLNEFKDRYHRNCDVLLLEEVHCLSGRQRTQTELAQALDPMLDTGKTVIFTGNRLPRQISDVNAELKSRLSSGIIATINPPDYNTRIKIVQRKARSQGVELDTEIAEFLAENLTGDIRRIEGAVVGLIAKSSLMKRKADLQLAREVIHDLVGEPQEISLAQIKQMICTHFQLSEKELLSKSRKKIITTPRQIGMYLARKHTEYSLEAIGREFDRDHATVLYAVRKIKKELNSSAKRRSELEFLNDQLEKMRWK